MISEEETAQLETPLGVLMLRKARMADAPALVAVYEEAAQWITALGIHQWLPGEFPLEWVERVIARGECYVAASADDIAGAFRVVWSDVPVWGERPPDAGYVHSFVVSRAWKGIGLGQILLDYAARLTAAAGRQYLRLDCVSYNPTLRAYYSNAGFTYLRDAIETGDDGEKWSLSLFERPASPD